MMKMKMKSRTGKTVHVPLLDGNVIRISPDGTEVPQKFIDEALRKGCVPFGTDFGDDNTEKAPAQLEGAEKMDAIKTGMKGMLDAGCKLTGSGLPNLLELSKVVGFQVRKPEAFEAWNLLEKEAEDDNEE